MKKIFFILVSIAVLGMMSVWYFKSVMILPEPSEDVIMDTIKDSHGFNVLKIIEKKPFKDGSRYGCAVRVLFSENIRQESLQTKEKMADFTLLYQFPDNTIADFYRRKWITAYFYLEIGPQDKIELDSSNSFLAFAKFLVEKQREITK